MKRTQVGRGAATLPLLLPEARTNQFRRWGLAGLFLLAGLTFVGCGDQNKNKITKDDPIAEVSKPVRAVVTDYEIFTGRTEPFRNIDVKPQITGLLEKIHFNDGQFVTQGAPLFTIDPQLFKAEVDKSEADLESSKAKVIQTEALYRRALSLLRGKAGAQEDVDTRLGDWAVAKASVLQAEALLRQAQVNLGYTEIRSPVNGRISKRMMDPGNVVEANKTVLTNIVALDPIYATFYVDERTRLRVTRLVMLGKVKSSRVQELTVKMSLADEERFLHTGTINFVDNQVDPQTGTLRVRGIFRNISIPPALVLSAVGSQAAPLGLGPLLAGSTLFPHETHLGQLLTPGLFVRVRVPIGPPHEAILVPEAALGTDQGSKFLFVVNGENKIVRQPVTIGSLQSDGLRVIEEGLTGNEQVIVTGLQRFRADMKVRPVPATKYAEHGEKKTLVTNALTK